MTCAVQPGSSGCPDTTVGPGLQVRTCSSGSRSCTHVGASGAGSGSTAVAVSFFVLFLSSRPGKADSRDFCGLPATWQRPQPTSNGLQVHRIQLASAYRDSTTDARDAHALHYNVMCAAGHRDSLHRRGSPARGTGRGRRGGPSPEGTGPAGTGVPALPPLFRHQHRRRASSLAAFTSFRLNPFELPFNDPQAPA